MPTARGAVEDCAFEPRDAVTLDQTPAFRADDAPGVRLGRLEDALAAGVKGKADGVDQLLVHDASRIGLIQSPDQDRGSRATPSARRADLRSNQRRSSATRSHIARSASKKSSVRFVPAQASAAPRGTVAWNLEEGALSWAICRQFDGGECLKPK